VKDCYTLLFPGVGSTPKVYPGVGSTPKVYPGGVCPTVCTRVVYVRQYVPGWWVYLRVWITWVVYLRVWITWVVYLRVWYIPRVG